MYVAPTPFALTNGTTGQATLIVPDDLPIDSRFEEAAELERTEANAVVVGYTFDLRTNQLTPQLLTNPAAGLKHRFLACRLKGWAAVR
jgi:hypothetical protein